MGMANLAVLYKDGLGAPLDLAKFVTLSRQAAEQGNAIGMANLGVAYKDGIGIPANQQEFFEWTTRAVSADPGSVPAMANLALAYREGLGTEKNAPLYLQWIQKAASAGDRQAMNDVAIAYKNGTGTTQDFEEYFRWTMRAAELGLPQSMHNLGIAYRDGIGTSVDLRQYLEWRRKAWLAGFRPHNTDQTQMEAVFVAFDGHEDVLPGGATIALKELRKLLGARASNETTEEKARRLEMDACLQRLDAFCLQVSRMKAHADVRNLRLGPKDGPAWTIRDVLPDSFLTFVGKDACTDFESLLFQGSAALDRLMLCIGRMHDRSDGTPPQYFKALTAFLEQRQMAGDQRAREMLECCAEATSLPGVFIKLETQSHNLRSLLMHKRTITEDTEVLFTVAGTSDGRLLAFDCEAFGYPVINTARHVATDVPYLVLNAIGIYLGIGIRVSRAACIPDWGQHFLVLSDSIDTTGQGPTIRVGVRMFPNGSTIRSERLKSETLARAFVIDWDM